ncbi:MAG: SAM-dependent methyltransferase [Tissierellia bacterium]|jgi:tRNA (adenine22-N1)-methyltransferase|nr:SAM-dependent methyltransferase [Tissierellia bacterium]
MRSRLEEIAVRVQGPVVADIGTDHGKLPCLLLADPEIRRVIATDISAASLKKCRDLLTTHPRRSDVELKVTDGLQGLDTGQMDTIVISGMGGHRIIGILLRALKEGKTLRRLLLSPQKGEEELRRFLHEKSFMLTADFVVKDEGKFYTVLCAEPGEERYETDNAYRYGQIPLKSRDPVFLERIGKELALQIRVRDQAISDESQREIEERIAQLKEVLGELQD